MSKKRKTASIHTRCNEYKDIFRVDDNILFCNYCNISVNWKHKSIIDNHCNSQKHIFNVKSQEENQNKTQQLTLSSTQVAAESKKQLIEDLIEAFVIADIPLEKVNSLLPFFKSMLKMEVLFLKLLLLDRFIYLVFLRSIISHLNYSLIQNQWLSS